MSWRDRIVKEDPAAAAPDAPKASWRDRIVKDADPELGAKITDDQLVRPSLPTADSIRSDVSAVDDALGSMSDGGPFRAVAEQASAGASALGKAFVGAIPVSEIGDTHKENLAKLRGFNDNERAERHARSPDAAKMGEGLGSAGVPTKGGKFLESLLANAGISAADMAAKQDDIQSAWKDGLKAGGITAAFQAALSVVSPAAKATKGFANRRAVKSLDPTLAQQEGLMAKDQVQELGDELLETGVTKFGSNVESMAPRLEEMLGAKGRRIGEIRDLADEAGASVDMGRLANKGDAKVAFSDATNEASQAGAKAYADNAANLAKVPKRSIGEAQEEVMSLNQQIPFKKEFAERTPSQQAYSELRSDITGQMDDGIKTFKPELAGEHDKLKRQFSMFKGADEILDKSVARSGRNADLGLRDVIMANAALKQGGLEGGVKAAAIAGVTKLARERGNAALAVAANNISRMGKFAAPLTDALARGPAAMAATHAILSKDPEYRAQLEAAESVP